MSFRVEVRIGDTWLLLDHARELPQTEAHAICAEETTIVGRHRVRMLPNFVRKPEDI